MHFTDVVTERHMAADLGPLLAAVRNDWERGIVIAKRAGIDPRTAGQKLAALKREGMVADSWTDKHGGVRLYRRGPNAPDGAVTADEDHVARAFHDAYERLAPQFGYKTRDASAVPWEDVPEANQRLMRATVRALIEGGVIRVY